MVGSQVLRAVGGLIAQLPPLPPPEAPPGSERILDVVSYLRWGAGAAILAAFFGGLILFTGGRMADHHRFGRMGTITMLAAVGAGFLYGIGYLVLSAFAAPA
jgi:hypothetical protein